MFFLPGFYFSLVGGHYKNKIPQLRGPLEAIKCIFMLQAAVCFLCELFQLPFFFWYPRYVYLICQMPNETFYDEFCDPKNQIPQLPETQTLPHAYMYICPFTPAAPVLFSCKFISICGGKKKHFSYLHIRSVAHVSFVYALDKYSISSFQQKTTHTYKHTHINA